MVKRSSQAGFTILETIIVLIVMIAVLSSGAVYMKHNADNNLNRNAAESLQLLTKATQLYVKDNFTSLNNANSSSVELAELINGGYLDKGFSDINNYSQRYKIVINQISENDSLQVLISTSGGDVIDVANMRKIAGLAGTGAGYSTQNGKVTGNQQGWSLDTDINYGHIASVSYVSAHDIVSAETFLRRDKFDGHPEWNQMNTDLDIQENNILAEKGDKTSSLNADVLTFNDDQSVATLDASQGLMVKSKQGQINVASDKLQFNKSDNATTLSAGWIRAAVINSGQYDIQGVYRDADNQCGGGSSTFGRIFNMSAPALGSGIYTFSCGQPDGYTLGAGRAYLVSVSGGQTFDMPYGVNCDSWNPVGDKDIDFCVKPLASDKRQYVVKSIHHVKRIEAVNVWREGKCQSIAHGSERSELCKVESRTFIVNDSNNYNAMLDFIKPTYECTDASIGSADGDRQNIFVINEDQDNDLINNGSCSKLKYHDW
jgi:type II secretory pathway pseudopilin PulG